MKNIKWVPIPGYEQFYEICSDGLIRSLNRKVNLSNGRTKTIIGQTIKFKNNGSGYLFVTLCKDGTRVNHYVHRLLAICFIKHEIGKHFVNHIDGNPSNNSLENLEWVSHSENVKHAYKFGLNKAKGTNHHMAVGIYDKSLGKYFGTIKEWCKARGVNYSTARNLVTENGKRAKMNIVLKINNDERA